MFIETVAGDFVNLELAERIEKVRDKWLLRIGEHTIGAAYPPPTDQVKQLIPFEGWECGELLDEAGEEPMVWWEPCLALALKYDGLIAPVLVTTCCPTRAATWGLRKTGTEPVHVIEDETFDSEAAWLQAVVKRKAAQEPTAA